MNDLRDKTVKDSIPLYECIGCKEFKISSEFWKHNRTGSGLHPRCKDCKKKEYNEKHDHKLDIATRFYHRHQKRLKQERKENYDKLQKKAYHLKSMYGLSMDDYNALLEKQMNTCAICSTHFTELKKGLFVDHCHDTGKVRGLLCSACNSAIGLLKENRYLFLTCVEYLDRD